MDAGVPRREIDLDDHDGPIPDPFHDMPAPITLRNASEMRQLSSYELGFLPKRDPSALTRFVPETRFQQNMGNLQQDAPYAASIPAYQPQAYPQQPAQAYSEIPTAYAQQPAFQYAQKAQPDQATQQALSQMQAYVVQSQQQTQQQIAALTQQIAGMAQATMSLLQAHKEAQEVNAAKRLEPEANRAIIREALDSIIGEMSDDESDSQETLETEVAPEERINIDEWES